MSGSDLARWERAVVGTGLAAAGGLAWLCLFRMARTMASAATMAEVPMTMPMTHPMSAAFGIAFVLAGIALLASPFYRS